MEYEADFEGAENFYEGKHSTGDYYYMLNLPKDVERLKVDRAMNVTAIVVPYVTTNSPYTSPGKLWFSRDYYQFKGLGADQKGRCFDNVKTFGDPKCAIAESMASLPPKQRKKSQRMALFNIFVVEIDGNEVNKLMLLDFSFANFAEVLGEAVSGLSKRRGQEFVKMYQHPEKGSYVTWDFAEASFGNGDKIITYYEAKTFSFAQHGGLDGKVKGMIPKAIDLDACLNRLSYEQVKAKFIDGVSLTAPAVETQAPPASKPEAPATKQAEKPEPSTKAVEAAKAAATSDAPFDDEGW